ncbi:hypothetical protein [Haloferax elongans]|uniref:hypothetical protein n=1 Tax=Haloferax elongans TaxID=403191 RepID=UPI00126712F4|nr:hypothetical protein [Haloferax elongans]
MGEYFEDELEIQNTISATNTKNKAKIVQFDINESGFKPERNSDRKTLDSSVIVVQISKGKSTAVANLVPDMDEFSGRYHFSVKNEEVKVQTPKKNTDTTTSGVKTRSDVGTSCIGCDPEINCKVCEGAYDVICDNKDLCTGVKGLAPQTLCILIGAGNFGGGVVCTYFVHGACNVDCEKTGKKEFCKDCETPILN